MKPMRFDFDTEFDRNGEILREGESYKRFFTQDDVDAARMWGVEEGREMEEGKCADALQAVASQMQLILARLTQESEALREDATRLALAVARQIAGSALDQFPQETLLETAREALQDIRSEPHFSVRCHPDLVDMLSERLPDTARMAGYDGAIIVRPEPGMRSADIRLEWASGAIERRSEDVAARIEEIVERWLQAPAQDQQDPALQTPMSGASAA